MSPPIHVHTVQDVNQSLLVCGGRTMVNGFRCQEQSYKGSEDQGNGVLEKVVVIADDERAYLIYEGLQTNTLSEPLPGRRPICLCGIGG